MPLAGKPLVMPGTVPAHKAPPPLPLRVHIWQRQDIAAALQSLTPSPHCSPIPGAKYQPLPSAYLAVAEAAGACGPELRWCASVLPALPACAPVAFGSMPGMVESSTCIYKEGLHTTAEAETCRQRRHDHLKLRISGEATAADGEHIDPTARCSNLQS